MAEKFGNRLRKWRKKLKLLQKNAADVLGVSVRTYQNWEENANEPTALALAEITRRMDEHK